MDIRTFAPATVAAEVAEEFIRLANECITTRGVFRVALAGGSTPKKMYEMLREATVPWGKVEFYFSDERFVPPADEQSNERMAREAVLNHIQPKAIFGMVTSTDAQACADTYERLLADVTLDLVLLGLGGDGHTASLFPGEPGVFETERKIIAAKAPVNAPERITLTPPVINACPNVWFIVTGNDKREALDRMLVSAEDWSVTPSQAIARHAENATLFTDLTF